MIFNSNNLIGLYRNGDTMMAKPGLHPAAGKLVGIALHWPISLQPENVEWTASVAFLSRYPEEVYFGCDIAHSFLMQRAWESMEMDKLCITQTLPEDVVLAQAGTARGVLLEIAQLNHFSVKGCATLGVTLTQRGSVTHMNHFYAVKGEQPDSLIQTAMRFDPNIAA